MNYQDFLNHAWNDHANRPDDVAARLPVGIDLVTAEKQVGPMAQLVAHVMGEHLGRWSDGISTCLRPSALVLLPLVAASQGRNCYNRTCDRIP